jgi:hypothetical protein
VAGQVWVIIPPSDLILPKRVVYPDEVIEYLKNEKPLHQVEKLIPDTPSDNKQEIVEKTPVNTEIASVNIKDDKTVIKMREHLVHCLEKGNFSAFPKNHVGFAPKNIKINTYKTEIDCECGKPNAIENMIGCEGIKGKKKLCNVWKYSSCVGNLKGNTWYCINQNLRLEESK